MQKSHLLVVTAILVLMAVAWFLLNNEEPMPPPPPPPIAKKSPPASPPPPPPHAPAVVPPPPKVEGKATVAPATPSSASPAPAATKPATPSIDQLGPPSSVPLAMASKQRVPRIDVIGPEGVQVSFQVFFDGQLICTVSGKLDAQTHRPFSGGLLAEGVCHSEKIVAKGQHEYKLSGQVRLPDGTMRDISFTTGPKNVSGVVEPAIEINSEGEAMFKLAAG